MPLSFRRQQSIIRRWWVHGWNNLHWKWWHLHNWLALLIFIQKKCHSQQVASHWREKAGVGELMVSGLCLLSWRSWRCCLRTTISNKSNLIDIWSTPCRCETTCWKPQVRIISKQISYLWSVLADLNSTYKQSLGDVHTDPNLSSLAEKSERDFIFYDDNKTQLQLLAANQKRQLWPISTTYRYLL